MCGGLQLICNYRPRSVVDVLPRHRDRKRQPGVLRQPDDHLPCCKGLEHLVAVVEWGSDRERAPAVGLISGRARHRTLYTILFSDGNRQAHLKGKRLWLLLSASAPAADHPHSDDDWQGGCPAAPQNDFSPQARNT